MISLISTSIFSITLSLLYYSSAVKQYSTDVLITIIILYSSFTLSFNKKRSLIIYAIIGGAAIWFSNVSIITLFVTGIYFLYFEGYRNKNYKILFPFLFWAISFFIYYYFFFHNHPAKEEMQNFWEKSFLPLNPFSSDFYRFLFKATKDIYGSLLGFHHFWAIPLIISLSGIRFMLKYRNYTLLYFCLAPIVLHLFISGLKLYPFSGRQILYIVPLVILLYSIGLNYLFEVASKKIPRLPNFLLILPVLIMVYPICSKFPIKIEEIKYSLNYIEKNIKKDEAIYVYYKANRALSFYKETGVFDINNTIIVGTSHRNKNHEYDNELLNLKEKVWLLFSHVYEKNKKGDEEEYIVNFLLSRGSELLDVKIYKGSSVYYIDTKKPIQITK